MTLIITALKYIYPAVAGGKEYREGNVVQTVSVGFCCCYCLFVCFKKAKILNTTKQFNSIGLHENKIALELCKSYWTIFKRKLRLQGLSKIDDPGKEIQSNSWNNNALTTYR